MTPVALGIGISAWFVLLSAREWLSFFGACAGVVLFAAVPGTGTRLRRVLLWAAILATMGCGLSWWRAERMTVPVIARPMVATLSGRVERVELLPAREIERLTLTDLGGGMPKRVRVSVALDPAPPVVHDGDAVSLCARIVPQQASAVPGGYDFQLIAWFQQLGGVGKALGPITVTPAERRGPSLRERLSAHIRAQIEGSAGGIASAFASGDRGRNAEEDEEAMRASGLTHLLSVSGLHISAVVSATFFLTLRLLALWPRLALRWPLVAIAAGAGQRRGWLYLAHRRRSTDDPQLRGSSAGLHRHRARSRGVHAAAGCGGALVVLLAWRESLVGPSFS